MSRDPDGPAVAPQNRWDWAIRTAFAEEASREPLGRGDVLGEFRILREIARGGMGVVYEAQQRSLDRRVALKVLPYNVTLDDVAVQRFCREASVAAQLQHDGIVTVFAVGSERGHHFFAMEFVTGAPLSSVLAHARAAGASSGEDLRVAVASACHRALGADAGAASGPAAAQWREPRLAVVTTLCAQVADALHYAHERGVVHRDVKPANVLVREDGVAMLTDFGLAAVADAPSLTGSGRLPGTPHYTSPEQARSRREQIDRRSDVFSLGVTLYELITLQLPFRGETTAEVLAAIAEKDPVDPRRLEPAVDRELAAIVLRALEKDPNRRYQTAAEFAADLRAHRDGRPVVARPPSWLRRCWRVSKRPRVVAAGFFAVSLVAVGGLLSRGATTAGQRYWANIESASRALLTGAVEQARGFLADCPPPERGFEWRHLELRAVVRSDAEAGPAVLPLPGSTGHSVLSLAVSPDGLLLAAGFHDQRIQVWDLRTGEPVALLRGHADRVDGLAFHPDGERLFSCSRDCTVRVWRIGEPRCEQIWRGHRREISALACSSAGDVVATGSRDGDVLLWDPGAGTLLRVLHVDAEGVKSLAFQPGGKTLASGTRSGALHVFDVATGDRVATLPGHRGQLRAVVFTPDGEHLCSGSDDGTLRRWDVATWTCEAHVALESPVQALAVDPGGRRLACALGTGSLGIRQLPDIGYGTLFSPGSVRPLACRFLPDDLGLAVGDSNGGQARLFLGDEPTARRLWPARKARRDAEDYFERMRRASGSDPKLVGWLDAIRARMEADDSTPAATKTAALRIAGESAEHVAYECLLTTAWLTEGAPTPAWELPAKLQQAQFAWQAGPRTPPYLLNLGMVQFHAGMHREALATITRADELTAEQGTFFNPLRSMLHRAMCHWHLGDRDEARRLLAEALAMPVEHRDFKVLVALGEAEALITGRGR